MMKTSLAQTALDKLVQEATKAAENSYSPYSGFRVGAALLLNNDTVVTGTNVENVSFGLTICAERAALVRAVSQFGPGIRIEAVAVANLNNAASPPCGACRRCSLSLLLRTHRSFSPRQEEQGQWHSKRFCPSVST